MSDLVGNPEDRFSHNEAHMYMHVTQGVQHRMVLVVIFCIFNIKLFCFVVAMCDLVHDVEAVFHLP